MAILPILEVPDARLRRMSEPVSDVNDEIRTLVADMFSALMLVISIWFVEFGCWPRGVR